MADNIHRTWCTIPRTLKVNHVLRDEESKRCYMKTIHVIKSNFRIMFLGQKRLTCSGLAWSTAKPGGTGHGRVWSGPVRAQDGNFGHRYVPPGGSDFGLRREERADGGSSCRNMLVASACTTQQRFAMIPCAQPNGAGCLSALCVISQTCERTKRIFSTSCCIPTDSV